MRSLLRRLNQLQATHPYAANTATAGSLGFVGDQICQHALERVPETDWRRAGDGEDLRISKH